MVNGGNSTSAGLDFDLLVEIVPALFRRARRSQRRFKKLLEGYIDCRIRLLEHHTFFQPAHRLQPNILVRQTLRSRQQVVSRVDSILHRNWNPEVTELPHRFALKAPRSD